MHCENLIHDNGMPLSLSNHSCNSPKIAGFQSSEYGDKAASFGLDNLLRGSGGLAATVWLLKLKN